MLTYLWFAVAGDPLCLGFHDVRHLSLRHLGNGVQRLVVPRRQLRLVLVPDGRVRRPTVAPTGSEVRGQTRDRSDLASNWARLARKETNLGQI